MTQGLTRTTVNLVPRAVAALEEVSRLTGDNKTDVINRALQVYAYLELEQVAGKRILLSNLDGSVEVVTLL